ncbi:MAG: hypothetical protein DDT31_01751 [Syntrophomonadaceae bacterium]|nr:hypothetical protein [Bacillota bacterium]
MQDVLKKVFNLGLGAIVITKEKAEEVVKELVKKGEVGEEESRKLVNKLIEKGQESRKEMQTQIEKTVKGVIEKLDISTRSELEGLKSEIERLKENLGKKK